MPHDQIAQAVADEIDLGHVGRQIVDHAGQALGMLGDFLPRAGVAEFQRREFLRLADESGHRRRRRAAVRPSPCNRIDNPPLHRRQFFVLLDLFELLAAILENPPSPPHIFLVQQSILGGKHIPLNPPVAEQQLIGP